MIQNLNIENGVPTEDGMYLMWGDNHCPFIGIVEDGVIIWPCAYSNDGPTIIMSEANISEEYHHEHFFVRIPNDTSILEQEFTSQN